MSRALASLKRLSPSKTTNTRCGGRNIRRTAVAAEASGGATIAPRATAADQEISGRNKRMTWATETTVSPTAINAKLATGRQLSLRSLRDASEAAPRRTGAAK